MATDIQPIFGTITSPDSGLSPQAVAVDLDIPSSRVEGCVLEVSLSRTADLKRAYAYGRQFMRTSSSRRYSPNTHSLFEAKARGSVSVTGDVLLLLQAPPGWDDLTEVKSGGPIGMLILMQDGVNGYLGYLAVREAQRQRGYGQLLHHIARRGWGQRITYQAHRTNDAALALAARIGYSPESVSSRGVVTWTSPRASWEVTDLPENMLPAGVSSGSRPDPLGSLAADDSQVVPRRYRGPSWSDSPRRRPVAVDILAGEVD